MKHTISVTIILAMAINLISCGKSSQVSKVTNNAKKDVEILAPASDQATITASSLLSSCEKIEEVYPDVPLNASVISQPKDEKWQSEISPGILFYIKSLYKSASGSDYDESLPIKSKMVTLKGDKKQTPYLLAQIGEDTEQQKYEFLFDQVQGTIVGFPIAFKGDTTCLDTQTQYEKDILMSKYLKVTTIKDNEEKNLEDHKKSLDKAVDETEKEKIEAKIKESQEKLEEVSKEIKELEKIADERGIRLPMD